MTYSSNESGVPQGRVLMINPPYVHQKDVDHADKSAQLPFGLLYAGELLEQRGAKVSYHDCQLERLVDRNEIDAYDNYGITVMGTQNIASANHVYKTLIDIGIKPEQIFFGGQGAEGLIDEATGDDKEFQMLFPGSNIVSRESLYTRNYWSTTIRLQLKKIPSEHKDIYFNNELVLAWSQGCLYGCNFCGAQIMQKERFYDVKENLKTYLEIARELDKKSLDFYVTALDFGQQALPHGNPGLLNAALGDVIMMSERYGIEVHNRALTRADSYLALVRDDALLKRIHDAGFYQFGIGADGASSVDVLRAMHKGDLDLKVHIMQAFEHAQANGFIPEILYVFGTENDTPETLFQTLQLCSELLKKFDKSIYRGFPAKDFIPGNKNWKRPEWKSSEAYKRLMSEAGNFEDLGFETLANTISHPNKKMRKEVNARAVEMSYVAHTLGRVQSFLTIPIMEKDGTELMSAGTFEIFREILKNYAPDIVPRLTLENLPDYRKEINLRVPKDK